ncbi:MAG: element excision factor XisH family protein [Bacteroidota bacterium]
MARRDKIHNAVRNALEKDEWEVTDDPLNVKVEGSKGIEIDLGAEKFIAAKKGKKEIAVEIKTFGGGSVLNDFHTALGQYLDYQDALEEGNIDRELFIAIPEEVHESIENFPFILRRIQKYGLKFVVIDIEQEKIVKWIK